MSRLRPIVTGGTTCGRHEYGAPLRPQRYESLRLNANTKQTEVDDIQEEKEPRELSSLHTKHGVN
eukprot:3505216-Pleurochrysis_carterae.AAC.1